MSHTHADAAPPRVVGLMGAVDRFFPLVWLGLYLLLPASGWAPVMFDSWFDQRRDLEALRSVLAEGRADAIADNVIGPAYIGAAALLHDVLGLSAEDALVWLTRGSYALSVAAGLVLVRVLVRRFTGAPAPVTLAAQLVLAALVFAAGTWYWSDVPWSHFFAAFLGVALYAVRFAPATFTTLYATFAGAVLALLALTRSFELVAILTAWLVALGVVILLRMSGPRTWRATHVLAGGGAFAVTTVAVYLATGKRGIFFLYSNHLDRQSGAVQPAEVAETPTFSPALAPVKLVQLFVEPCFYSLCSLSDYVGGQATPPPLLADASGQERLWRLPLAIQLPSLVLLPLGIVATVALVVWFARNRPALAERARALRLVLEATLASTIVVLGYSASTMTGSSHLRYGFARDFLLPALLTGVVAVGLASAGLWLLLSRRAGARVSPEVAFVAVAVLGAVVLVSCIFVVRSQGLPRIESRHLGSATYTASCRGSECEVSVDTRTTSGGSLAIPESSTLTFGCGSDEARFTIYVRELSPGVPLQGCAEPRLVAAWPTVMGLPPGSFELAAVAVENAP